MLNVYENREKQKVYPLCIGKETKDGRYARSFASLFFDDVGYIGKIIEACPVIYDSPPFNRRTKAIKDCFVLKEDFSDDTDIVLIDKIKLRSLFKEHKEIIPRFKEYIKSFVLKECKTVSTEVNHRTLLMIKEMCEDILSGHHVYEGEIIHSRIKGCMSGFVANYELDSIIMKENPDYFNIKNKSNKFVFADGELRIKLW